MKSSPTYKVKIEADENDEPFFIIPEPMWKELEKIGWQHEDNLGYEAEHGKLTIKNIDLENRKK